MNEPQSQTTRPIDKSNPGYKHGLSRTPAYSAWQGIKKRCTNPSGMDAVWYKGVQMFSGWINSPEAFIAYMGPQPSPQHSVDRFPNRDGNYEPGNVRWATWTEQNRNKNDLHWVEYKGEKLCIAEFAERHKIPYFAMYQRLVLLGWEIDRAISTPVLKHEKVEYCGKLYSLRGLVREHGLVGFNTFLYRLRMGQPFEQALNEPPSSRKRFGDHKLELREVPIKSWHAEEQALPGFDLSPSR